MNNPLALLLLLTGCSKFGDGFQGYYPESGGPTLSGVSPAGETGNVGGQLATLSGSGFGDDPNRVTVAFGSQTAELVSVTDAEIQVIVPPGSIASGVVDVVVSTPDGRADLSEAYDYDVGGLYEDQTAHISVASGSFGVFGSAEFLEFAWPRFHLPAAGYNSATENSSDWAVFSYDDPPYVAGLEDLYVNERTPFALRNPALEGYQICASVSSTAFGNPELQALGDECDGRGKRAWPADTMDFCVPPALTKPDPIFQADWPTDANFFGIIEEDDDGEARIDGSKEPIALELDFAQDSTFAALSGKKLLIPPSATFLGVAESLSECVDSNGDGSADAADNAMSLSWTPTVSAAELLEGSDAKDVRVTVHASMQFAYAGWYGIEAFPVRAIASADDSEGRINMPLEVLYQFPSISEDYPGLMIIALVRITDYTFELPDGTDLVVSYSELSVGGLQEWSNPLENGPCGDCVDNDGDGWLDDDDLDCEDGDAEVGYTDYPCNDGLDNDDDGIIDADEEECRNPDDDETNCNDDKDNDGDGYTDREDGECDSSVGDGIEDGVGEDPNWECSDGEDGDEDGWTDFDDPDCANESDIEAGFGDTECNDGVDNDGDGKTDERDPRCFLEGAEGSESVTFADDCTDGADNDGDGYTDEHDPGCELDRQGDSEGDTCGDAEAYPYMPTCYDCEDNDGDGDIDADDDACVSDGEPDGFGIEREPTGP